MLDGQESCRARRSDPPAAGIPHGIFNKTDTDVKCLFWVSPSRRLYDLFWALHNLGPTPDPAQVVAISAAHEVDFLPPPDAE